MNDQNYQFKVIATRDTLDEIAQHTCKTVYANCKDVPLRALTDQTAKYIARRFNVSLADAHQACAKWMLTEATIDEAYTPRQRERLRASHWMQRQVDLHDEYVRQAHQRIQRQR